MNDADPLFGVRPPRMSRDLTLTGQLKGRTIVGASIEPLDVRGGLPALLVLKFADGGYFTCAVSSEVRSLWADGCHWAYAPERT